MSLPPPRDHKIPLAQAAELTKRYRTAAPPGAIIAGMYHRAALDEALAQPGCAGIRFYFAREVGGELSLIIVGVDANGDDLATGDILDVHFPCPPICSAANPLNS